MRALFLACLLLIGCAQRVTTPRDSVGISWNRNISHGLPVWMRHLERELDKPVLALVCHGGPNKEGKWYLWPDYPRPPMPVEHAAWVLRDLAEGRQVVILSCNENASLLFVPDVLYARQIVSSNRLFYPGWATHIKQFQRGTLPRSPRGF